MPTRPVLGSSAGDLVARRASGLLLHPEPGGQRRVPDRRVPASSETSTSPGRDDVLLARPDPIRPNPLLSKQLPIRSAASRDGAATQNRACPRRLTRSPRSSDRGRARSASSERRRHPDGGMDSPRVVRARAGPFELIRSAATSTGEDVLAAGRARSVRAGPRPAQQAHRDRRRSEPVRLGHENTVGRDRTHLLRYSSSQFMRPLPHSQVNSVIHEEV